MTKMLNSGLALTLLALGSISASADNLYISDSNGKIGYVNLSTPTPTVTVLGSSGVAISDIGFTSNGQLYGTTHTGLYSISLINGFATSIGNFGGAGGSNIVGLVGDGSELLASSYSSTKLFAVDVAPFSITALTGATGDSQGDLAFGSNGALYDTLSNGNLAKITVSGNSISSTTIGSTHVVGSTTPLVVSGLATAASGVTYAIAGTEIYVIDLNTAALTPFFNYSGKGLTSDSGAAIFATSLVVVPEPGSVALLIAGLAGLVLYQRRRAANANNVA